MKRTSRRPDNLSVKVTDPVVREWIRAEALPTPFCAGCGHGIILRAIVTACHELGLDRKKTVFVSGIGCSGWISSPMINADTLHTTHGRPVAFAAGLKMARPELTVIVIGGDGDIASIGGNHLIHAARRNLDMAIIMADNMGYSMTGGQVSPTTPGGAKTSTTPKGNPWPAFDAARLVKAAGAAYVARFTTYHYRHLVNAIKKAISVQGTGFVQAISNCPIHYGRNNLEGTAADILRWYREVSVNVKKAANMTPQELEGKIIIGEF